jgi:hypothetical protein
MASLFPPKKNTAFTLYFTLYKNDGTIIANPGTITKKVSIDGAAVADISNAITEEDTTYGQCSVVLTTSEMNGDAIWVYIKDDTSGCVPFTATIYTAGQTMDEIKSETAAILTDTGTTLDGKIDTIDGIVDSILADTGTDGVVVAAASKTGYALSAAGIQAIWDALSSALTTAGSIGKRLVDYLTGDIFGRLGAPAGASVSADVAAVKSDTAAVLVDTGTSGVIVATNSDKTGYSLASAPPTAAAIADAVWDEASAGHTDAGKAGAQLWTDIDAILADTDVIGAAGAGLSAVPWNAAWDAEVQSECTDALNAYDPPTKAELDSGLDALPAAAEIKTAIEAAGSHLALILEDTGTTIPAAIDDVPTAAEIKTALEAGGGHLALVKAKTDNLPAAPAAVGSQMDLVNAPNATAVAAIQSGLAVDSTVAKDATVMKAASYTAPDNAGIAALPLLSEIEASAVLAKEASVATVDGIVDAIKAKTDNLPASPAAAGDSMALTSAAVDAILDEAFEGTTTFRQALRALMSVLAGKSGGGGTDTLTFQDLGDSKARITATVDENGNRTTVVLDLT